MPLHWFIDSRAQLVTIVAEGPIVAADVHAYIDAVVGAGALAYAKLYDGLGGAFAVQPEELLELGVRFRSYHSQRMGPVALVLPEDQREALSRLLGVLASADRPLRLFKTKGQARRWLDSLKPGTGTGSGTG
jgi:hypothetical protein